MIKPSSTEVQNIARIATQGIEADLKVLQSDPDCPLNEFDIIQLHIERLLTATIKGFETELLAKQVQGVAPLAAKAPLSGEIGLAALPDLIGEPIRFHDVALKLDYPPSNGSSEG